MVFRDILHNIFYSFWPIRKIGRFIKRLFLYLPVIWKDEDWDYDYLYQIIKFKLERMEIAQHNDNLHVNSDRYAKEIRSCLAYLDRYRNWPNYIEYPIDDIYWEFCENGLMRKVTKNSMNECKRKRVLTYEEFNYNMFWKRFLQWHRHWWT